MRSKKSFRLLIIFSIIAIAYLLGPCPSDPQYNKTFPQLPADVQSLERFITVNESKHQIKQDNEARIVWADSAKSKTPYAIVYLHGFSASQREGGPVHTTIAHEFNCNLFLSRLSDHGVDTTESLLYFTADRAWESAKEALAIGNAIGEKVILISTSTGGTLALKLAATYPDKVFALVNLSPNIAINNPAAFLLNDPWGLQIARAVMGGKYRITGANPEKSPYWNQKYRLESVVELQQLIETSMTDETFSAIRQPSLTMYYYKDEDHQDPEVRVNAMLEMNDKLATPSHQKFAIALPEAGAHVIGSDLTSKDYEGAQREIRNFFINTLMMQPKPDETDKEILALTTGD